MSHARSGTPGGTVYPSTGSAPQSPAPSRTHSSAATRGAGGSGAPTSGRSYPPPRAEASLEVFLKEAESVQRNVDRAIANIAQIEQLHSKCLYAVGKEEIAIMTARLDDMQDKTNNMLQELKSRLKAVSGFIKKLPPGDANIAKSRQAGLARKLQDAAEDYQSIQVKYKQKYREKLEREIRIAKPDATSQEVEQALDSNTGSIFSQQLLSGRLEGQRQVLQQVQSRHEELKRLEESIEELFNLYQDMQMLIETQQETINTIATNVEVTETHLEAGTKEIGKAINYRIASRKRAWWIFGIVFVLLIVLGVLLYFFVIKDRLPGNEAKPADNKASSNA